MSTRTLRPKQKAASTNLNPPTEADSAADVAMPVPRRRGQRKAKKAAPSAPGEVPTAPGHVSIGKKRVLSEPGEPDMTQPAKRVVTSIATVPASGGPGAGGDAAIAHQIMAIPVKPPKHARKVTNTSQALPNSLNELSKPMRPIAESQAPAEVQHSLLHDVQNADEDALSDVDSLHVEDVDQMAETLAEMSESEDELLSSLDSNPAALEACLAAEAPVWSQSSVSAKGKEKETTSVSVQDVGHITLALPNPRHLKSEAGPLTSMSSPAGVSSSSSLAASGDNSKTMVVAGKKPDRREKNPTVQSKTQARAQLERPAFKNSTALTTPSHHSDDLVALTDSAVPHTGSQSSTDDAEPALAAADYKIVYSGRGGPLSLKAQHSDIQDVIRAASRHLERDLVAVNAFPDARNRGRSVRMALVETVKKMHPHERYAQLAMRMVTDGPFTRVIASIPNQRISTFRGRVKEKSDIAVAHSYGLVPGKAQEHVAWLLPELIYIYPTDYEKRYIAEAKPYQHPIVTSILREVFFKGPTSFAFKNVDIFASSLPPRPEKEIPMAMLALVGAAIHASLTDWSSGHFVSASSFSADRYYDAYNEHLTFLKGIKHNSASKYHTMMYKLYATTSGATQTNGLDGSVTASSALTRLNLSAMDED